MTLVRVLFVKGYLHTCTQNEPMLESVRGLPEKAYGLVFNLDSLICLPVYLLIIQIFFVFVLFLQVQFKGKTIKLNLRINTLLFGSDFTTERYKEDGTIERTKSSDLHCYLVGETESFYSSVAISDCDGLVRIVLSRIYA